MPVDILPGDIYVQKINYSWMRVGGIDHILKRVDSLTHDKKKRLARASTTKE